MVVFDHRICGCVTYCGYVVSCVFFFQAEDGIRDLVRSRGLGDVYKRQGCISDTLFINIHEEPDWLFEINGVNSICKGDSVPVSYTHLTLPTSDLV